MADSREAERRPVRGPLRSRSRQRWTIAGGVAACWLILELLTGSLLTSTVLLVVIAGLAAAGVAGLRSMGITRDHPWLRRWATRPWRDGRDVLNIAVRHLSDVFVVTPHGSVFAPDLVELRMNPEDLASSREWTGVEVVSISLTEAYEDQVAKRGARFVGSCRPEVYLVADESIPQGRYALRRGLPAGDRYAPDSWDEHAWDQADGQDFSDRQLANVGQGSAVTSMDSVAADPGRTIMDGMATVMEQIRPAVPVLRLVTGSWVTETSMSGARAGRGPVELELPYAPTVSRVHARFTFSDGQWRVTNEGMNGLAVNGVQVSGEQPLTDGDSIRWGKSADAPVSRVEIG
jgi:FHA domain